MHLVCLRTSLEPAAKRRIRAKLFAMRRATTIQGSFQFHKVLGAALVDVHSAMKIMMSM